VKASSGVMDDEDFKANIANRGQWELWRSEKYGRFSCFYSE